LAAHLSLGSSATASTAATAVTSSATQTDFPHSPDAIRSSKAARIDCIDLTTVDPGSPDSPHEPDARAASPIPPPAPKSTTFMADGTPVTDADFRASTEIDRQKQVRFILRRYSAGAVPSDFTIRFPPSAAETAANQQIRRDNTDAIMRLSFNPSARATFALRQLNNTFRVRLPVVTGNNSIKMAGERVAAAPEMLPLSAAQRFELAKLGIAPADNYRWRKPSSASRPTYLSAARNDNTRDLLPLLAGHSDKAVLNLLKTLNQHAEGNTKPYIQTFELLRTLRVPQPAQRAADAAGVARPEMAAAAGANAGAGAPAP
jgi:hypothetical protein